MGFLGFGILIVFVAIIIFALFIIGITSLIASLILNGIFTKKWKQGYRYGKIWAIISRICIVFSSLAMIPFLFVLIIAAVSNSKVPEDFVDGTEISYNKKEDYFYTEEDTYLPIKYNVAKYQIDYSDTYFAYKPKGVFSKSSWKDIKTFNTDSGYQLLYYEEDAYIKESEMDLFYAYYDEHFLWNHDFVGLTEEESLNVEEIYQYYKKASKEESLTELEWPELYITYRKYSSDDLFYMDYIDLGRTGTSYMAFTSGSEAYAMPNGVILPDEFHSFAGEQLSMGEITGDDI